MASTSDPRAGVENGCIALDVVDLKAGAFRSAPRTALKRNEVEPKGSTCPAAVPQTELEG
jgi:hypothetical protein